MLFVLAGCNQIYGLDETRLRDASEGGNGELLVDLDLDGVSDEVDPCLAPMRDEMEDFDGDGRPVAMDPCPFDTATSDGDQDTVPDACDPFPSAGGDKLRCYMSFASTDLNARLWSPRNMTQDWSSREGELYSALSATPSGIVSKSSLEVPMQMTYDALVVLNNGNAGAGLVYAFRLWARAGADFSNQDLGCEISGDVMSTRLAVVRGNDADIASSSHFVTFPRSVPVRIRLTIAAASDGGNDVRCAFEWPMFTRKAVKAHTTDMPAGHVAFGTENLAVAISALAIYERADIQPLP